MQTSQTGQSYSDTSPYEVSECSLLGPLNMAMGGIHMCAVLIQ